MKTKEEIESIVGEVVAEHAGEKYGMGADLINEVKFDSLERVEVVMECEKQCDVNIKIDIYKDLSTLQMLADALYEAQNDIINQ